MISEVQICNMALGKIGEKRINDMDEGSEEANYCNLFYDQTRDEILASHQWKCATVRKSLARLSGSPITEDYEYQYQLPTDFLKPIEICDNPNANYVIEENKLLTNEIEVILHYIKEVNNPTMFDSLLVEAIYTKLASKLAVPLCGNNALSDKLYVLYEHILHRAQGQNEMDRLPPEPAGNTDWLDAGRS